MKIFVGSLVVCHILSGAPSTTPSSTPDEASAPKAKQMTGTVKEIFKEDIIVTEEDNIPVKKKKTMFMVSLNNDKGLIKIGAQACLPVVSEKEYSEYKEKKKKHEKLVAPKPKISTDQVIENEMKLDEKIEKEDLIELDSKQKQELLKNLEE